MAWCPKCKSEYVEGKKVCVDCGCELVDFLEEDKPLQAEDAALIDEAILQTVILNEEAEEFKGVEDFEFDEEEEQPRSYHSVYVNNEERAEENRTSAYTLLIVGSVGLVLIVLVFLDVIHLPISVTSKYMTTGVMGVLFFLFIIMGMISMKNSKILKYKASKENKLTMEIKKWCVENMKMEQIDDQLRITGQPEELKYFQRTAYMKKTIQKQFVNLDESYLERLIEEVYPDIFEEPKE